MPHLDDIITGFESVRSEGAAFVAYASVATSFSLVDLDRLVALGPIFSSARLDVATDAVWRNGSAVAILWSRRDGSFGAMATIGALVTDDNFVSGTQVTRDDAGFRVNVHGYHDRPQPVVAFAVAADPYVAAEFCRTAAATAASELSTLVPSGADFKFPLDGDRWDLTNAVYSASFAGLWSRSVKLVERSTDDAYAPFARAAGRFVESAATITRDRLFSDCRNERRLLKAFVSRGRSGVLGVFNCHDREADIEEGGVELASSAVSDAWRVDDVEGLVGEQFAAWHAVERKLFIIDRGVDEAIDLPLLGAELIHLVPILQNVAPIGLIDELDATASMTRVGSRKCRLADGGQIGWYAAVEPSSVLLDGVAVAFDYEQASGLVTFHAERGRPHDSEVLL